MRVWLSRIAVRSSGSMPVCLQKISSEFVAYERAFRVGAGGAARLEARAVAVGQAVGKTG